LTSLVIDPYLGGIHHQELNTSYLTPTKLDLSAHEFLVCSFYICLVNNGITQGSINL
jgi:hypothetical protein